MNKKGFVLDNMCFGIAHVMIIVVIVIVIAIIILDGAGTIEEYCLKHPNVTLYTLNGSEDKCINVLNEAYFNNQLKPFK